MMAAVALTALGAAAPVCAQEGRVRVGPHFNVSDDADLGVGADIRWPFLPADRRLALTASFDWFFPDDDTDEIIDDVREFLDLIGVPLPPIPFEIDVTYWEANLNLTYDFGTTGAVTPYAGVGVNYAHSELNLGGILDFVPIDSTDDEFGANVLAGMRFGGRFYVEAKREVGGGELFVLTAGVRF
jgi:hypothetical protein